MVGAILLGVAGGLFVIEGAIKFIKPDFTILRMTMPCGGSFIILGAGLICNVLEV